MPPAISAIRFPFELKKDQLEAAEAWIGNGCRGSVIFSTGTGKTEIAFECARRAAELSGQDRFPAHKFDLSGKDHQLSGLSGYLRLYLNDGKEGQVQMRGGQRIPTPTGYVKCPTG